MAPASHEDRLVMRRNGRARDAYKNDLADFPVMLGASDPNVILPREIKATIACGEAAFKHQGGSAASVGPMQRIITSVVDQAKQDRRDIILDARDLRSAAKRQQPPMTDRLRAVVILVDRLVSDGVPFAVGPNSKMNRLVQAWLHERAKRSRDTRKSRGKLIARGAVRELLKQVRELLPDR